LRKIIVCIHGLGNKPSKELLSKWWRQSLKEGLKRIGKYVFNPKIEMVYWADLLYEKPLNEKITDVNNQYYLDEVFVKCPHSVKVENHELRKKVLSFIEKQFDKLFLNNDNTINFGFISDFVIHKYFKDLETYYNKNKSGLNNNPMTVGDLIRKRLTDVLDKYKGCEIFLIAHSMGTIVAYDVLTLRLTDTKIKTFITIGSPLGIPVVISKIAREYKEKFNLLFCAATPQNIIENWYNFSDLEDKVAMNYNLADDFNENENGVKPIDYIVNNNYLINGVSNPHKAYGYLQTPEFAEVLYKFLILGKNRFVIKIFEFINEIIIWLTKRDLTFLKKYF